MERFTRLVAKACPLRFANLNTDQILPARYLKWPRAQGLGKVLFADLRFDAEGREKDFPINRPAWRDARILVAERNFGCGSSREAAVYALYDHGIRCVIAPSYGDIFAGNAVQNGLLAAIVCDDEAAALMDALEEKPELPVTVDLEQRTIMLGDRRCRLHHRSCRTDSFAQRLGRHRAHRELSRQDRGVQGCGRVAPAVGGAAARRVMST